METDYTFQDVSIMTVDCVTNWTQRPSTTAVWYFGCWQWSW